MCLRQDLKIHTFQIIIVIYIILIFVALCTMWQTGKNLGIYWCMWNDNDTPHVRFRTRPWRGCFPYFSLEGRWFKQTYTSMWCINESYKKYGAVSARPKPSEHNQCKQTILTLQVSDFVRLNRMGGWRGSGPLHSPTLLYNDQEKNQLLNFMSFCPNQVRHGVVNPIFD